MKKEKKKRGLSYEKQKRLYGYGFLSLWLIGTIVFFIIPAAGSLIYSFQDVTPGAAATWVGFKNYTEAFARDPYFRTYLADEISEMLRTTPVILIFSLFSAVLINQKFRGRGFVRAVFFLPVIVASGPVYSVITGDMNTSGAEGADQFSTLFETDMVTDLLEFTGIYGLSQTLTESIKHTIDSIFAIVWRSGIQILIFLAALQNIPPSAREAAQLEGATAWEYFWKITFPYVSPMILANLVFTVIDSFTDSGNKVMGRIIAMQSDWKYGLAASMVWSYFAIVIFIVGILFLIAGKLVYYEVD
ncbi:MAG: sugar ABC transporter permease [Oscillospiraceae bacterium]|nr:sugar ABC transporter permease [Oscillospiraceae bacterium]